MAGLKRGLLHARVVEDLAKGRGVRESGAEVSDSPLWVDNHYGWQSVDLQAHSENLFGVERDRIRERPFLDELPDDVVGLPQANRQKLDRRALDFLVEPFENLRLQAARTAPGGPELDQDSSAGVISQTHPPTLEIRQIKIGRRRTTLLFRCLSSARLERFPDQQTARDQKEYSDHQQHRTGCRAAGL